MLLSKSGRQFGSASDASQVIWHVSSKLGKPATKASDGPEQPPYCQVFIPIAKLLD
jgi:hypothetical protein